MINSSFKVLVYWCAFALPFGIYTLIAKNVDFTLALGNAYTLPSAIARPAFLAIVFGVTALLVIVTFLAKSAQSNKR